MTYDYRPGDYNTPAARNLDGLPGQDSSTDVQLHGHVHDMFESLIWGGPTGMYFCADIGCHRSIGASNVRPADYWEALRLDGSLALTYPDAA